jgi:Family of unknown function (DUF6093)
MGRKQAEALMESTCVITRVTGSVQNDDGSKTPTLGTIYSGPCRLRFPTVRPEQSLSEGQTLARDKGILSLPVSTSAGVRANDTATVTLGDLDPGTVVVGRIEAPFTQTHSTARRFPIQVVS